MEEIKNTIDKEYFEKVLAQIWDCKYEPDKINIIISKYADAIGPDDLIRRYRKDFYHLKEIEWRT